MLYESLYREWNRVKSFEGRWSISQGIEGMLRLEGKEVALSSGKTCSVTFWRLGIPFLCGEADVDWLAFLP